MQMTLHSLAHGSPAVWPGSSQVGPRVGVPCASAALRQVPGLGARGQSRKCDGFVRFCKFVNGMCICLNLLFFGQILTRLWLGG